ncbi:TPA: hypothetical protein HA361_06960 [Candidatus Woesearchaeota archaeon]|nr:hypothetical protein [Candidatus Woesearchaeota archaeon]HII68255.1 hypothetical protein [Candidatus Woesearchaeota archaeon]
MAKLKTLLPTLKERKRYLVFDIIAEKPITNAKAVEKAIVGSVLSYIGEKGLAQAGILFLANRFDCWKQKGIIRVAHNKADDVRSALMLIHEIDSTKAMMHTVGASGILKKALGNFMETHTPHPKGG